MADSLRVRVVEFGDRAHYQLQWTCPLSGRKKTKSSGIPRTGKKGDRDKALKVAAEHGGPPKRRLGQRTPAEWASNSGS